MATTVTVIQDIELESTIKVVADGAGGGTATIDISALSGAAAANNLVAITGIKSSCVTPNAAVAGGYIIGWVGGDSAAEMGDGCADWQKIWIPTTGTGNITVAPADPLVRFTLILSLRKVRGFAGTAPEYRKVALPRQIF